MTNDTRLQKVQGILDSIDTIDAKTKELWYEIYTNAVNDRDKAITLYEHVTEAMLEAGANWHVMLGVQATKYLEQMKRANDQLIRLAELVERSTRETGKIDVQEVYAQIVSS